MVLSSEFGRVVLSCFVCTKSCAYLSGSVMLEWVRVLLVITGKCLALVFSGGAWCVKSLLWCLSVTHRPMFLLCPADQVSAACIFHPPPGLCLCLVFLLGECIYSFLGIYAHPLLCCVNEDVSVQHKCVASKFTIYPEEIICSWQGLLLIVWGGL